MIMRALLGAALALLVASAGHAQQSTEPPASHSTMDCPMHPMQGQGMQEMQGMQGMQGGMGMHAQGASGGTRMQGMQPDQAAAPGMQCECVGGAARGGFAALLGRGAGSLTLTTEQTTELDAIMARAREAALAVLTAEQRSVLEAQTAAEVEHQH